MKKYRFVCLLTHAYKLLSTLMLHRVESEGKEEVRKAIQHLFNIWDNKQLSRKCKLQLYQSGVCSILAHGHEAWKLTSKHMAMLKGWNARCLSLITRNEIRDECREPAMDLVLHLRKRRLRWVGHLLREEEGFLARRALAELFRLKVGGRF